MLLFCALSCLSVAFLHCAQMAEDIAYISPMSLPNRVKIWLYRLTLASPNFVPKWPNPCWSERRRHSVTNCGRIEIEQWSQWTDTLWETTITLSNSTIIDPLWPPFPQNGGPTMLPFAKLLWPWLVVAFYPRDAMLVRVIAIATCPSVRPSVRLSVRHAPVLCQNEES